jgi:exonuclease III
MTYTYTVAPLNINGIANHTRIKMFEDFLWTQYIDIAFLQEVVCQRLDLTRRYTQHINVGTEQKRIGDTSKIWHNANREAGA